MILLITTFIHKYHNSSFPCMHAQNSTFTNHSHEWLSIFHLTSYTDSLQIDCFRMCFLVEHCNCTVSWRWNSKGKPVDRSSNSRPYEWGDFCELCSVLTALYIYRRPIQLSIDSVFHRATCTMRSLLRKFNNRWHCFVAVGHDHYGPTKREDRC